jgi:hypothetical protein
VAVTGVQFTVWREIGDDVDARSYTAVTHEQAAELRALDDHWTSHQKIHWPIAYRVRNDVTGDIWIVTVDLVPQPSFKATQAKALAMEPATHVLWHGRTLCDDRRLRGVPRDWPQGQRWLSLDDAINQIGDPPDRCKECWIKLDARLDEDIDMWNRAWGYAVNYYNEEEKP